MSGHKFLSTVKNTDFQSGISSEIPSLTKDFAGMNEMSTPSDRKDLLQTSFYNRSSKNLESSLEFLRMKQNEIYNELNKEVDNLRIENKDLKFKLTFLTNSSDILGTFPVIDPVNFSQTQGAKSDILSHYIDELHQQLLKESDKRKLMEEKIALQQKQITETTFLNNNLQKPNICKLEASLDPSSISPSLLPIIKMNKSKLSYFKSKIYEQDPSFPTTIYGCHSMIKVLIKSRDRMDREIKLLQRKLQNHTSVSFRPDFNMHNMLPYSRPLIVQRNKTSSKRPFILPKLCKEDEKEIKNRNLSLNLSFYQE